MTDIEVIAEIVQRARRISPEPAPERVCVKRERESLFAQHFGDKAFFPVDLQPSTRIDFDLENAKRN